MVVLQPQPAPGRIVLRQETDSATETEPQSTTGASTTALQDDTPSATPTPTSASTAISLPSSSFETSSIVSSITSTSTSSETSTTSSDSSASSSSSSTSTSASTSTTESSSSESLGGLGVGGVIGIAVAGTFALLILYMLFISWQKRRHEKRKRPRGSLYVGSEFFQGTQNAPESAASSAKIQQYLSPSPLGRNKSHRNHESVSSAATPLLPLGLQVGGSQSRHSWAYADSQMSFQTSGMADVDVSHRDNALIADATPNLPARDSSSSPVYSRDYGMPSQAYTVVQTREVGRDRTPPKSVESVNSTTTLPMPYPESEDGHLK